MKNRVHLSFSVSTLVIGLTACGGVNGSGHDTLAAALPDAGSVYNSLTKSMKSDPDFLQKVSNTSAMNFSGYLQALGATSQSIAAAKTMDQAIGSIGDLVASQKISLATLSESEVAAAFHTLAQDSATSLQSATFLHDNAVAMKIALFLDHPGQASAGLSLVALDPCRGLAANAVGTDPYSPGAVISNGAPATSPTQWPKVLSSDEADNTVDTNGAARSLPVYPSFCYRSQRNRSIYGGLDGATREIYQRIGWNTPGN